MFHGLIPWTIKKQKEKHAGHTFGPLSFCNMLSCQGTLQHLVISAAAIDLALGVCVCI